MSRTNKRDYTGSKKFDKSCRNDGSCPCCRADRQYKNVKHPTLKDALREIEE